MIGDSEYSSIRLQKRLIQILYIIGNHAADKEGYTVRIEFSDKIKKNKRKAAVFAMFLIASAFLVPVILPATAVFAVACTPNAGGTGLSAFMVVSTSHTTVNGKAINAAGCDIGVYIAPGTKYVTVTDSTIMGANDHAIFAQDAQHITITHNLAINNGINGGHSCNVAPAPCVSEDKGIQFAGTSNSLIGWNVVSNASADGGIGVTDDNVTFDSAALTPSATKAFAGTNDVVTGNTVDTSLLGCGIVIATYDENAGIHNITVTRNTIVGTSPAGAMAGLPPYIGQIVVAIDAQNSKLSDVKVEHNSIVGSLLPGIVVHSNVFGDKLLNVQIIGNTIADNGFYPPDFATGPNDPQAGNGTTGISVIAEIGLFGPLPNPIASHTVIKGNTILGDTNGIWLCGTTNSVISGNSGNPTNALVKCPAGAK